MHIFDFFALQSQVDTTQQGATRRKFRRSARECVCVVVVASWRAQFGPLV